MERLKIGDNIKNTDDVRNLIIQLINRTDNFELSFIARLTENYTQDSSVEITKKEIYLLVDNILDLMQQYNYIKFENNKYTKLDGEFSLKKYYEIKRAGIAIC